LKGVKNGCSNITCYRRLHGSLRKGLGPHDAYSTNFRRMTRIAMRDKKAYRSTIHTVTLHQLYGKRTIQLRLFRKGASGGLL